MSAGNNRKPTERDVREQIQRGARDEREHRQRTGQRDPGQPAMERVWRESIARSDKRQGR